MRRSSDNRRLLPPSTWRALRALRAAGIAGALALAGVTCDAPTALTAPGTKHIEMAWDGDTVLLAGTASAARVTVRIDGEDYPFARLAVTSSNPDVLAVAADGSTLEAKRLGRATLTVRLLSAALPSAPPTITVNVLVGPKRVTVAAGTDTLRSFGDTTTLTAFAIDADDRVLTEIPVQWTALDTTIATIDPRGVARARGNGTVSLQAEVGGQLATVQLTVRQRVARIVLSPAAVTLDALGADTTLAAAPVDARGAAVTLADLPAVSWESTAPSVAAISGGRVTAADNGTTWVVATSGTTRDSALVTVAQRATRVVIETPSPVLMRSVGEEVTLRGRAYDRRGFEVRSGLPTWRSHQQLVAYVEPRSRVLTALGAGKALVLAEMDGASDSIDVEVEDVPDRVRLEPASHTLSSIGDTLQLRWSIVNARGVSIPDAKVTLRSFDTTIVRVLPGGAAVAVGVGNVRVTATSGLVADTSVLTVVNAVAHVDIAPTMVLLASIGDTIVPEVTVRNSRGDALDRSAASWRSANDAIARVVGGVVVARDAGETVIHAWSPTYDDRRDSLVVMVTNAPASIVLPVAQATFSSVGSSRSYSADVRNARGALIAGYVPEWRSASTAILRVTANGVATSTGTGTTRLIATAGAVADTIVVTVRDSVVSVDASPSQLAFTSVNDTVRATAVARNELGAAVASPALAWFSSNPAIAAVTPEGLIIARGVGGARVTVTSDAAVDTITVTVTNAPAMVDVVPVADTLFALGDSVPVDVVVRNARGDLLDRSVLTWSTADAAVARVSASGTVTARDTGATWITAVGVSVRDSVLFRVSNEPASVTIGLAPDGAAANIDTMTAVGQALTYVATARNRNGRVINAYPLAWRSTAPSSVSVTSGGVATSVGFGSALVVVRAGEAEDTSRLVVADPRRLYVDNSVVVPTRFGTRARPYATVQDAVNAAGVDDTVIVQRGYGYSESVTLGRRIALLGDSAAFVTGGRDPQLLPRIHHDLGIAGIVATTPGASYIIAYLGVQHSVDGEAVLVRHADNVLLKHVYVNPLPGFRTGRGIFIDSAAGSATVLRSRVDSVYGFGVRVRASSNARVDQVTVHGVGARAGYSGAGVELSGGVGGIVRDVAIRRTAGPQVLLNGATQGSLLGSRLAGEQQLVRVTATTGGAVIRGNSFDLRRQEGDPAPIRGTGAPDPSGLEILGSAAIVADSNVFIDIDGASSLMDAVRIADVRGVSGATYGAVLSALRFQGGRTGVRSARSTWQMTGSRADGTGTAVSLSQADTATLVSDTLVASRTVAIGGGGADTRLALVSSHVEGPRQAVVLTGAAAVLLRSNAFLGTAQGQAAQPSAGAIDVGAARTDIVGNTIARMHWLAGIVSRDGVMQVDSNLVTRNLIGVRRVGGSLAMRDNAIYDNDALPLDRVRGARALVNDGINIRVDASWWGDAAGPQRAGKVSSTSGDSIIGNVVYDSLTAPITAHQGTGPASALHKMRGDDQSGLIGTIAAIPLVVRVVDASGRPLAGTSVTFRVKDGEIVGGTQVSGTSQRTVVSNASGLAEATYRYDTRVGTSLVTATANSLPSLTFTMTAR